MTRNSDWVTAACLLGYSLKLFFGYFGIPRDARVRGCARNACVRVCVRMCAYVCVCVPVGILWHTHTQSFGQPRGFHLANIRGGGGARASLVYSVVTARIQKRHKLEKRYNHK